jgi:hypothetical protein
MKHTEPTLRALVAIVMRQEHQIAGLKAALTKGPRRLSDAGRKAALTKKRNKRR